jgi:hypothetical protein
LERSNAHARNPFPIIRIVTFLGNAANPGISRPNRSIFNDAGLLRSFTG